jgi:hypothetical protein
MKWIDVNDETPPKRTRVLVTDGQCVTQALIDNNCSWSNWYVIDEEYLNDITHWAWLPNPPKGKQKK